MTIVELQERLEELHAECESILMAVEADQRDHLTEEEQEQMDSVLAEIEAKKADLARMQSVESNRQLMSGSQGRRTPADPPGATPDDEDEELEEEPAPATPPRMQGNRREPEIRLRGDRGRWGWRSFGEFASNVRMACMEGGTVDQRLIRMQPSTHSGSQSGADGGYAIPPDFRQAIIEKVMGEDTLFSRTDQMVSSSNNFTFPKDETTPWQTSGGVQAFWEGEAAQKTASKIALDLTTIRLNKLISLVPVTDELLEDAPALDTYLRRKAPAKMNFKINLSIVQGTGAGQPLGILESAATVSVAKVGSQLADTIVFDNITEMYNRMPMEHRQNAVWLVHPDVEPELMTLSRPGRTETGDDATGWGIQNATYIGPGGLSQTPFGTLLGRPVLPTQACNPLGDKGDIIFADLSEYMTITKGGAIRTDVSIHLYFDYDISTFRFIFRLGGQPWWSAPITDREGGKDRSAFVTLDERAA